MDKVRLLDASRVLVLGAHADDEFGCSGMLARLLESGAEVHEATFSMCQESVPAEFPPDILRREVEQAAQTLGIKRANLRTYDFQVRHFPTHRQEILEELVRLRKELDPDLVLLPSLSDMHQDHHVIAMEGLRCFKHVSVLGYELPMNSIAFQHACFVSLEARHIEIKIKALMCYQSQRFRPYVNEDFIWGLARVRGVQGGAMYAEAFEVLRLRV